MQDIKIREDLKKSNILTIPVDEGMDITETPISPFNIKDDQIEIFLSEEVTKEYNKLVKMINEPSTALEYPIVLLGKHKEADGIRFYFVDKLYYCYNQDQKLSSRVVYYDQSKLNEIINYANQNGYNFVSLAHTHPNISQEEKANTIAGNLSDEIKEQFKIREAGLNLSFQDLIQYESLYEYYKDNPNIRTFETIIMYNGEIAMFGKHNEKYKKIVNIYDGLTFENIKTATNKQIINKNVL